MTRILFILALLLFVPSLCLAQLSLPLPRSGSTTWGDWSFEWTVGGNNEGLELKKVQFKGVSVIAKASLPVVRVKYKGEGDDLGEGCGPYLDRIDWDNIEVFPGHFTKVFSRTFDNEILEIAVFAQIGGYDLWQAWMFHKSGRLEPVLYSRGWSCSVPPIIPIDERQFDHKHHPYWRIDFDVESTTNEIWQLRTDSNGQVHPPKKLIVEDNVARLSETAELAWTINKPGSNKHVLIRHPDNELKDPPGMVWFSFSNKDAAWRKYDGSENERWEFDWDEHLGYKWPVAENINRQDSVFWIVGHISHQWGAVDVLVPQWHRMGAIIDVVNF